MADQGNQCIRCGRDLFSIDFHTCDACALSTNAGEAAEAVGEIVLFGGYKEVSWSKGKLPAPGTKLYAQPPAAVHGQSASTEAPAGWLELQDDPRVNEIVSGLYRRFKDWSQRGFSAEDVTWCEVKADVIRLIAATPPAAIPAAAEELKPLSDNAMDLLLAEPGATSSTKRSLRRIGRKVERDMLARLAALAQPVPVQQEAAGLPRSQEPKYTVTGSHIVNRASGEAIPHDEPVFIFRARDKFAVRALLDYAARCTDNHYAAVRKRVKDFRTFASRHPERMKKPDTAALQPTQGAKGGAS